MCIGESADAYIINGESRAAALAEVLSAILAGGGIRGGRSTASRTRPARSSRTGRSGLRLERDDLPRRWGCPRPRLGKDDVSKPLSTGKPILELFG